MNTTGKRLRQLREAKQMSQNDVAKYLGISRTAYVKYESGDSKPIRKLPELSILFGVSSDYIMGISDIPNVSRVTPNDTPDDLFLNENQHYIINSLSGTNWQDLALYVELDEIDQAVIRGEMKGMLRAEKYQTKASDDTAI